METPLKSRGQSFVFFYDDDKPRILFKSKELVYALGVSLCAFSKSFWCFGLYNDKRSRLTIHNTSQNNLPDETDI